MHERGFLNKQFNYWLLFPLSVFMVLLLLPLLQHGTFIDGMLYKTVAFNYSEGSSGFWNMRFTATSMSSFCEQPPLYFFLLGNFYRLFGVHELTDRFFTLTLFLVMMVFILATCRVLFGKGAAVSFTTFICLLLLSIPVFCWSYVNQVIEPLVCALDAVGIYLFFRFQREGRAVFMFLFTVITVSLFLAKGFQSCFIIALPLISLLLNRRSGRRMVYFSVVVLFVFPVTLMTLSFYRPALDWFECYYRQRLALTMNNVGATTTSHLEIIVRFFTELIPPLLIALAVLIWISRDRNYPFRLMIRNFLSDQVALILLAVSVAGSFPFAVSLVQRGFYLVPSFLFFILALAHGFRRYWLLLFNRLAVFAHRKAVRGGLVALTVICALLLLKGADRYKRDESLMKDVNLMLPYLQEGDTVMIEEDFWNYFSLHAHLYMAKKISLSPTATQSRYVIVHRNSKKLERVDLPTTELDLARK
jgi:4-amino-4-deoxy-L-arabinose transferase-like glycosyltransferase